MSEELVVTDGQASGLATGELRALVGRVARPGSAASEADLVDRLDALERLKAAAAAAQADLARRESPHQARGHLRLARRLHTDLPHTYAALQRGDITERRATILATETHDLTPDQRRRVDALIGPDLPGLGDTKLAHAVRRLVFGLDPEGASQRRAKARARRHLSHRVYGDGTAVISAVVSDHHLNAILTSLTAQARRTRATYPDDPRSQPMRRGRGGAPSGGRGRCRAGSLKGLGRGARSGEAPPHRLPGRRAAPATARCRPRRPDHEAARPHALSTLQRLYALPGDGTLIAATYTSRTFRGALGELIDLRDHGLCRTPYCNSPIAHKDHAVAVASGGETTLHNGQGLCEACNSWVEEPRDEASRNHAKEAHGWRTRTTTTADQPHSVQITTPTGHHHDTREPGLPTTGPPRPPGQNTAVPTTSPVEYYFSQLVLTA